MGVRAQPATLSPIQLTFLIPELLLARGSFQCLI